MAKSMSAQDAIDMCKEERRLERARIVASLREHVAFAKAHGSHDEASYFDAAAEMVERLTPRH